MRLSRPLIPPAAVLAALLWSGIAPAQTELGPFGRLPEGHGQSHAQGSGLLAPKGEPPLFTGLGDWSFPVTTANPQAQAYFDQGLRWAYGFNHAEAVRSFRKAQQLDPACALCAWGEGFALGPNINKPMDPADLPAARAAVQRAQSLAAKATPKEQAMIQALAVRYGPDGPDDQAFAQAMRAAAERFPEDADVNTLAAEAMMDTQPWDYWEADGTTPKGQTQSIVSTLERVLARHPDHAGAIHLYIHAVEASDRPERALPHARRLAALMPAAGHVVHMPSHIYYRLGMWRESLEQNKLAVAADRRYFAQVGPAEGIYRDGYAPHNLHFVLVSAQMAGDGAAALDAAGQLSAEVTEQAALNVPWTQPIKAAPYFNHAQFSPPQTILALEEPGDRLPYVKAMWHYARGVALSDLGRTDQARAEAQAIERLAQAPEIAQLAEQGVPAPDVLKLAGQVVDGLAARAEGDLPRAIGQFRQAVRTEDSLSYTEPPWWYYPVRQTLGATLLMAGDPKAAEAAFQQSLEKVPNNGWALYGLMEARAAQGDQVGAQEAATRFRQAWAGPQAPQLAGL